MFKRLVVAYCNMRIQCLHKKKQAMRFEYSDGAVKYPKYKGYQAKQNFYRNIRNNYE